jgi:hypothetical protein
MKKILKTTPAKTIVIDPTYKEVWVADDGTEFNSEISCRVHEKKIAEATKVEAITKRRIDVDLDLDASTVWWYAGTEDELETIKNHLGFYVKGVHVYVNNVFVFGEKPEPLKVGDWISVDTFDGGDYNPDKYYFSTLEYLVSQCRDVISAYNRMKDLTK